MFQFSRKLATPPRWPRKTDSWALRFSAVCVHGIMGISPIRRKYCPGDVLDLIVSGVTYSLMERLGFRVWGLGFRF